MVLMDVKNLKLQIAIPLAWPLNHTVEDYLIKNTTHCSENCMLMLAQMQVINIQKKYIHTLFLQSELSRQILTLPGASGGVAIFLSKYLALEAHLLSASALYSKGKDFGNDTETTQQGFHLNSSGALNNFGFQIHFLF